ncbi:MAG: hypothetical protein SGI91_00310 [Alphaproteobacteria bacterium]|mgnify:CR=1 FL=1|nr:hypothetical protein [Alphaproteobacteria bacterium]
MRKVLLASAALLISAGSALAAGSATVNVSTTLAESCSMTEPGDITLSSNAIGGTGSSSFDVSCNFVGTGTSPLNVTLTSQFGGVKSGATVVDYTIAFESGSASAFSTLTTPLVVPSSVVAANTAETKSFSATLLAPVVIAGSYNDVVTVAVSP